MLSTPIPQYLARHWLLGSSVDIGAVTVRMGLGYATVTKIPEVKSDLGCSKTTEVYCLVTQHVHGGSVRGSTLLWIQAKCSHYMDKGKKALEGLSLAINLLQPESEKLDKTSHMDRPDSRRPGNAGGMNQKYLVRRMRDLAYYHMREHSFQEPVFGLQPSEFTSQGQGLLATRCVS